MPTATLKATPTPAGDTATGIRINRALTQPGAKGKKGFLLWVQSAFPKAVADKAATAALAHVSSEMAQAATQAARGPQALNLQATARTMGSFRGFGDLTTIGFEMPDVSASTAAAINATDSAAADSSWLTGVSNALQLASQAYLTKTQVDAQNQIFQTNLQRAQQGLPPIPINPTAYGLPAPTVNVGLTSTTTQALLWVAGGLGALWLLSSFTSGSSRKRAHA
ncbi:MAG TPA: hypothetical protein VGQ73_02370 [Gemmatimonadales bacterium]|jgi:hypothetical protein|nr:hypothetical protein [Gemmatimonadales bacterium]